MNEEKKSYPEIRGKVVAVLPEYRSPTGFVKREIVVDAGYNRPSPIKVTFKQERAALADNVAEGDQVTVRYALDGRAWVGPNGTRYFTDVVGLELAGGASATQKSALATWRKVRGEGADDAGFVELCKQKFPGKKSRDYTSEDWAAISKAIEDEAQAEADAEAASDVDDLPF